MLHLELTELLMKPKMVEIVHDVAHSCGRVTYRTILTVAVYKFQTAYWNK